MFFDPNIAFIIRIPQANSSTNAQPLLEEPAQPPVAEEVPLEKSVIAEPQPFPPMEPDASEETSPGEVAFFLCVLAVYLVVIGPLDYVLVRFLKRPWLTWITFPFWILLFTCLFYGVGLYSDFSTEPPLPIEPDTPASVSETQQPDHE